MKKTLGVRVKDGEPMKNELKKFDNEYRNNSFVQSSMNERK